MDSNQKGHYPSRRAHTFFHVAIIFLITGLLLGGGPVQTASAGATFQVNTPDDLVDSDIGDGKCMTAQGKCSLRAAIMEANHQAGADTILLPPGLSYTLTLGGSGEDGNFGGDLDIRSPLTISGDDQATTFIDGNGLDRVFDVNTSSHVLLKNITITGGFVKQPDASGGGGGLLARGSSNVTLEHVTVIENNTQVGSLTLEGGGILNRGVMALTDVSLQSNTAASGGGISNTGSLTLHDCHLRENQASLDGGGLYSTGALIADGVSLIGNQAANGGGIAIGASGTASITASTLHDNRAEADGGGVHVNAGASSFGLENATLHGNQAGNEGGGIYSAYSLSILLNTTLTANTAISGGGLYAASAVYIMNSILAENQSTGGIIPTANCGGPGVIASNGHNLEDGEGCQFDLASPEIEQDTHSENPLLGPLQFNGGPVQTRALLPGSPAIDAGDVPVPSTDARGIPRGIGSGYDLGAYEKIQVSFPEYCHPRQIAASAPLAGPLGIAPGQQVTSSLTLSGSGHSLWDLDVTTQISNPDHRLLQITLISPQGKQIALWGGAPNETQAYATVFAGALWDDHALWPLSLAWLDHDQVVSPTVPEEALGAFVGSDPDGVWTLVIRNLSTSQNASLSGWSLQGTACSHPMRTSVEKIQTLSASSIPDQGKRISQIQVSDRSGRIVDLDLIIHIHHPRNNDLILRLTSPSRQQIVIAYRDGEEDPPYLFDETTWDDQATTPVSQIDMDDLPSAAHISPRSALSIFNGQAPEGIWTLEIEDARPGAAGELVSWGLQITTTDGIMDLFLPHVSVMGG